MLQCGRNGGVTPVGKAGEPLAQRQPVNQDGGDQHHAAPGAHRQGGHTPGRGGDVRLRRPQQGVSPLPPLARHIVTNTYAKPQISFSFIFRQFD